MVVRISYAFYFKFKELDSYFREPEKNPSSFELSNSIEVVANEGLDILFFLPSAD